MNERNNQATVTGQIVSEPEFDYEVLGEKIYRTYVSARRLSGTEDVIPVLISERLIEPDKDYSNRWITVNGQFRSFRKNTKVLLFLFAEVIEDPEDIDSTQNNEVILYGEISKEPVFRQTPLGRDISDVILKVERNYGHTDYIPCILWGRNAWYVSRFAPGTRMVISGRIQSREYVKKISEEQQETKVAYEVSVNTLKVEESDNDEN